jgi:general secretion pathway protein D
VTWNKRKAKGAFNKGDGTSLKNGGIVRYAGLCVISLAMVALTGCPKGNQEFDEGKKSEATNDYDSAVIHYDRALKSDPLNTEYKLKLTRMRFEAGQYHVEQGRKLREMGNLQLALAEFQKALMIDPASPIAQQEIQNTINALAAKGAAERAPAPAAPEEEQPKVMAGPPQLKPLSRAPINLKMTNDSRVIYDTVAKLAGLTVVFDPDFTSRRIAAELTDVTLEQALDIVSLESKAFWKPVTNNIIFVAPDQAQKRRDYEEEVVRTIYLKNTILPQDLTEIINGLRQLLDLRRVQQFNSQNAIIVRDTPDKVMLAEKIVNDIDKPKAEVVVQFSVLQARRDRIRDLGINPGTSVTATFTPPGSTSTSTTVNNTTNNGTNNNNTTGLALSQLRSIGTGDYSITLPNFTATALLTDSQTRIIDDPEIRMVDGQDAKLRIGDRVPVATGSFQAGVGVGATGAGGSIVNPLVNTQFQYIDVGVIVDVTPRIHPENREVSLKLSIEVSSVTGRQPIGGIDQPVISTRKIEHDVRLQDGEVNILGGLIERTNSKSITGWPGLSNIPFLRYFTSQENVENEDQEVLIVVTPHIIRIPNITAENLRGIASGTDTNPEIRLESVVMTPPLPAGANGAGAPAAAGTQGATTPGVTPGAAPGSQVPGAPATNAPAAAGAQTPMGQLAFEPATVALKAGETTTVGVVVQGAQDLYSIPMLMQYDPKVISVEDVRQGGFLSGGQQPIAVVQRVDKERGQAIVSATRMPNTPGVSGSGTIFGVVLRGVGPGSSTLSILQVNARDSQQRPLQFVTKEATVKVQ